MPFLTMGENYGQWNKRLCAFYRNYGTCRWTGKQNYIFLARLSIEMRLLPQSRFSKHTWWKRIHCRWNYKNSEKIQAISRTRRWGHDFWRRTSVTRRILKRIAETIKRRRVQHLFGYIWSWWEEILLRNSSICRHYATGFQSFWFWFVQENYLHGWQKFLGICG